ncbi:hypothetical protein Sjap_011440 [Stephania japonica]|uniref:Uncharacterized protein n=1 Tax=Stephania japonica TaxID=461633 RepID=A0AAP0JDH7_9MAGN
MILGWLSQSTTQQPLQEDMQHTIPNLQNLETPVTAILEHLIDEEELSLQPISDSEKTMNAATLESVEFDEFLIVDEYLSEPEETLDVSLHEPDITITQSTHDEIKKDIKVIPERLEELQKDSKEDQPLVLMKPPWGEVPNELLNLKEGMPAELPKAIDAPFVVDILKGEGIT